MKWPKMRTRASLRTLQIAIVIFTAASIVLVIASPIGLKWIAQIPGMNWANLSNVGQTYGAISALLTALAFGGVVISLLYQARDVEIAREQSSRTFHHELLKMEMEDPFYMNVMAASWGAGQGLVDYDSLRQHNFVHMWVSFWEGQYSIGQMSDREARFGVASELFVSSAGRRYWSIARAAKLEGYNGRRLRFVKIVDQVYSGEIADGFPAAASVTRNSTRKNSAVRHLSRMDSGILICAVTGGIILAVRLVRRQFSHQS